MQSISNPLVTRLYHLGQEMDRLSEEQAQVKKKMMEVTETLSRHAQDAQPGTFWPSMSDDGLEVRPWAEYGSLHS